MTTMTKSQFIQQEDPVGSKGPRGGCGPEEPPKAMTQIICKDFFERQSSILGSKQEDIFQMRRPFQFDEKTEIDSYVLWLKLCVHIFVYNG